MEKRTRRSRVLPSKWHIQAALKLQEDVDKAKEEWDAALLRRNSYFYRWGTEDEPALSASALGRILDITANATTKLFNGGSLSTEERIAAKDLKDDDLQLD